MSRAKWTCPPFLKLVGVRAGAESSAGPESTFRGKCKNGGSVFRETQNGGQRFPGKASAAEPSAAVSLTFPQHLPRKKSLALKRESRPSLPPIFFGGETKDPTSDVMHKIWKQDTKLGGEKVSCSQPFADLGRASYKQTFFISKAAFPCLSSFVGDCKWHKGPSHQAPKTAAEARWESSFPNSVGVVELPKRLRVS